MYYYTHYTTNGVDGLGQFRRGHDKPTQKREVVAEVTMAHTDCMRRIYK